MLRIRVTHGRRTVQVLTQPLKYLTPIRRQDRPPGPRSPHASLTSWKFTRLGQDALRHGGRCRCCHCYLSCCSLFVAAYGGNCQSLRGHCAFPEAEQAFRSPYRMLVLQAVKNNTFTSAGDNRVRLKSLLAKPYSMLVVVIMRDAQLRYISTTT
ncbi:hypothetical protein BC835DRAFT_1366559 [Cytidiella melzeri]|nr:hypothetical protein BC835DRAFT_1366559 [Cytidiella melzeri]